MSQQRGVCRCTESRKSVGIRVEDIFQDGAKSCTRSAQLGASRSQCVDGVRVNEVERNVLAAVGALGDACARTARDARQNLEAAIETSANHAARAPEYCSSDTCSPQLTGLPLSSTCCIAM